MTPEPQFQPNAWAFDERVASQFDEMLERSIPQYEVMREACYLVSKPYVQDKLEIVDLGCSRGEAVQRFIDDFGARCRYVLVEASEPMYQATSERYKGWIDSGRMSVFNKDLRSFFPSVQSTLTLSILTLMFIPLEYRQQIVRKVFKSLVSGGAFILVEKVLGSSADIDSQMREIYHAKKAQNGYTLEEIERKRLALEGKLVPVTTRWNEELLKSAGFSQIECFWRWMNFAGWVAVKE